MANLRPWRKLKLQVFVTDKWNDHVEDQPDGALAQVGGHGAWDKDQAIQVGLDFDITLWSDLAREELKKCCVFRFVHNTLGA